MKSQDVVNFKSKIAQMIMDLDIPMDFEEIMDFIEVPPQKAMGDYALPCFKLAKTLKKSPMLIADNLSAKIMSNKPDFIDYTDSTNGYLNMFVTKTVFIKYVLESLLSKGEAFGSSSIGEGKNVLIDFSSPNIAKPFHVGHFKATVLGSSLYNIYKFCGFNCTGINYLGDWGTQFGKLIVAYKLWSNKDEVEKDPVKVLYSLYVKFHEEAEKDPSLTKEAQQWFKNMEDGDQEALSLWQWFKEESMNEFQKLYNILGVKFDVLDGESNYNSKVNDVVELLESKNLLQQSNGADIVDLSEYGLSPCLIKKSDGASLYATRDIAAAIDRKEKYDFDKALYVVAVQQNLHFQQWFKVVELLGFNWYKDLNHVGFGMVSLETGTIKTRTGNVIFIGDVLTKAIDKVKAIMEIKNNKLKNKEEVSAKIAVGAMIYSFLSDTSYKDSVFSLDKVLDFNGETGPYLQYTYARVSSILKKVNLELDSNIDPLLLPEESAISVFQIAHDFPSTVIKAMEKNEPSVIASMLMDLAHAFNSFYHTSKVVVQDEALMKSRLSVVKVTEVVMYNGLKLLGMVPLEKI